MELLEDNGVSATVVGKEQVKAINASDPDPNRLYNMAYGIIIQNRGEKLLRATTDEFISLQVRTLVADVDKSPLTRRSSTVGTGGVLPGGKLH